MKGYFKIEELINGSKYKVEVWTDDGDSFRVMENDSKVSDYQIKEDFTKDFPEVARWIFPHG